MEITDQDEREAIEFIRRLLVTARERKLPMMMVECDRLRALLQRATRSHD